jgi:nucleoside-diphosphate-sugar epimerase
MKILVTGGAGYIGSILVPSLLIDNHEVHVLDNFRYGENSLAAVCSNKRLEITKGDTRDTAILKELVKNVDVVIPLAAIVGAPACDVDPITATSTNRDAIHNLLRIVSPNQWIIMPTTNSAYGTSAASEFLDEDAKLNPLSLYARDKVEVEIALTQHNNFTSFRLATVFGMSPRMRFTC